MDDVMSSVFAVAGSDGMPASTALLLAEPRVVVCDTYAVSPHVKDHTIELVAKSGQRFQVRSLRTNTTHPFGPSLFAAPESLRVRGLRLNPAPVGFGERFQVAVAAGEKTGISTGNVTTALYVSAEIQPIGAVNDLTELACYTLSGASGAPFVDDSMAVRGFIVAGNSDPKSPLAYAYTADHWAPFLLGSKRTPPARRRGKGRPRNRK
jgi:hypothetical protein